MKFFRNRINIHRRKIQFLCLVRNIFFLFCSVLDWCLPNLRRLHPTFISKAIAFLVVESFDWVQQGIFEVILLNRSSMKEGKSERGNFKQPKQRFESSQVLRIMTD